MYSNGVPAPILGDGKATNNSVFNEVSEDTMFEDMTCTITYNNGFNLKRFRPMYTEYWLRQGCGKKPINEMLFTKKGENAGWRNFYNNNKDDCQCGAFWTNMDNSYFS